MTIQSTVSESKDRLAISWISVAFFGAIHAVALSAPWFFLGQLWESCYFCTGYWVALVSVWGITDF